MQEIEGLRKPPLSFPVLIFLHVILNPKSRQEQDNISDRCTSFLALAAHIKKKNKRKVCTEATSNNEERCASSSPTDDLGVRSSSASSGTGDGGLAGM